ncbi:MAG: hypothetical protein EZS28_016973 [Streblomastix strix]|uniref:Tyr recombinase domain-containing protein n=1 Tax=Streblomastix strix TaxID=222440 RepID=A0A5J4VY93_9EUKA|nr:MAG: hypothetical protein EZS28_016973 [Streblomastix strix]
MDNQSKQEQAGSQEINNIPGMELEHRINDVVNNQVHKEIGDGNINQISAVDTVGTISNRKKPGKAYWTNPIYKSSIHTTRTSYHVHELGNEQMSKQSRMVQPDQTIEKSADRGRMVDDTNQEQQTQEYRNSSDLSNDYNGYVSKEMVSKYLKNVYQIQDLQDNQYKEQQMDSTEVGRDTQALQQYFAEYWAQQQLTILQLSTLEQPCLTIAIYIIYLKPLESDAYIIQARNSISTLFELKCKPMNSIRNKVIEQLMKKHVDRAAKVRKEIRYWKLSQLMQYISKQALLKDENKLNSNQLMKVSLILIMVYTVLRMAEVQRVELRIENINQGEIEIATMTMTKPRGPVEKTLKAAQDRTVCPIRWIQSWLDKREVKGELKKEEIWRNRRKEKVWSADKCSKGVKQVLAEAAIKGYNIASIRKASISETIDKNMTQIQINRWSGHNDTSATVRVN